MIAHVLIWGLAGCLVFTVYLALAAWLGWMSAVRDEAGVFRRRLDVRSAFAFGGFLLLLLGWPVLANGALPAEQHSFVGYWLAGYAVLFVINLWDLIVLDWAIIVFWHPAFLALPDTPYYTTLTPHVQGFFRGLVLLLAASVVSAALSTWLYGSG